MALTYRVKNGAPLTWAQVDENFRTLDAEKVSVRPGYDLSQENFTPTYKQTLDNIPGNLEFRLEQAEDNASQAAIDAAAANQKASIVLAPDEAEKGPGAIPYEQFLDYPEWSLGEAVKQAAAGGQFRQELESSSGSELVGMPGGISLADWSSQLKFPQQFPSLKEWAASGGGLGLLPGTYIGVEGLFFPFGTSIKTFGKCVLDFSAASNAANFPDFAAVQIGNGSHALLPKAASNYGKGLNAITFVAPHGLAPGDLFCIYNPTDFSYASWRAEYRAGEFCRVLAVTSPTRVVLERGLYASYLTSNVDMYKINAGPVTLDGALEVIAPEALPNIAAVKARRLIDFDLSNLIAIAKKNAAAFILDQCVSGRALGVRCVQRELTGIGNDYGCIPSNCQDVELEGFFVGSRHGLSTGGYSGVGAVVCRDVHASGTCSTSGEGGAPALGLHGNTEFFTWNGKIIGGYNGCGNFNKISGDLYPMPNGVAISHTELTGYSHDYSGLHVHPGAADPLPSPTFRGVIDLGGNNEAAAADTIGGLLDFSGMVVDAPLATAIFRVTNRNSPATNIRVNFEGARILRGAAGYEALRVNHVTGALPGAAGAAVERVDMRGFDASGDPAQLHGELTTTGISIGGFVDITLLTTAPTTNATVPLPTGWFKDAPIPDAVSNTNFVGSVKPIISVVATASQLTISVSTPNGSNFTAANVVRVFWTARTPR